ncbi:MAG TPA: hypothetical protein VD758_00825 [Gemmatimonadaceae bacterium]|nr:hypothetical protein [Gemmatimonadaceae bacterium]
MPAFFRSLAVSTIVVFLGCSTDAARSETTPKPDAGNAGSASAGTTAGVTATGASDSAASRASADSASASAPALADTATTAAANQTASAGAASKTVGTLLPGRSKQDQETFNAAIRMGERMLPTWPTGPRANAGALLPQNRIVAYYGNPHSKKMGVLGEYPEQEMLQMLDRAVAQWKSADPATPVIPAIHLVTVIAQGAPGSDNMWRRRETPDMIERSYKWAQSRKGLLFLDIQASHSTLEQELPPLLKYLERPDVHLGIDPEFYMHYKREGLRPSSKVGQMYAKDVNYVINTLDRLVTEKKLPPKILVVHRFREDMVPDAEQIHPTKNVQVVMDMDGWGPAWLKFDSYAHYIVKHPVQYTGFKLFYHNDTKAGGQLLTPREVLQLRPKLSYIQYQ